MDALDTFQHNLDVMWILLAAAMVLFMQAGFTALESGLTRSKNSINVAIKNIADFTVSVMVFFFMGYALMYGESYNGWLGLSHFSIQGLESSYDLAFFLFQATFAGTAATIVSGAVAERMRFTSYLLVCIVVVAVVYPVSGHWIWNTDGWLAKMGVIDLAGAAVVHILGASLGLAGAILLGPRIGRFDAEGNPQEIQGHNLVLSAIGVFILWFGWFGFNGGSTLIADAPTSKVIANTLLAGAAGGIGAFLISLYFSDNQIRVEKLLNGVIAGLVSVTAGAAVVDPSGAVLLGLFTGVCVYFFEEYVLLRLHIDDPVNVISAHGLAGVIGMLGLVFLAPVELLPAGSLWQQFSVQFIAVCAVFAWGFGIGLLLFGLLKASGELRVTTEAEEVGLNIYEHGAKSNFADIMLQMQRFIVASHAQGVNDLTIKLREENGTEAGDIGRTFNQTVRLFQTMMKSIQHSADDLQGASVNMTSALHEVKLGAMAQSVEFTKVNSTMLDVTKSVRGIAKQSHDIAHSSSNITQAIQHVFARLQSSSEVVLALNAKMLESRKHLANLVKKTQAVRVMEEHVLNDEMSELTHEVEASQVRQHLSMLSTAQKDIIKLEKLSTSSLADVEELVEQLVSLTHVQENTDEDGITTQVSSYLNKINQAINQIETIATHLSDTADKQAQRTEFMQERVSLIDELTKLHEEKTANLFKMGLEQQSQSEHFARELKKTKV